MCYAYPGPRCSYHAKANLASASKALAESKERFSALENSKSSMDAQEYEAQVSEMNSNLNSALQGYKQSAELYWETRSGRAQLGNLAQDNGVSQEHVDSVVSKLRKGEPITHEDKNPSTGNPRGAKFLNKMVSAHQSYYRKTADYHKAKEITTMIDRKNRPEYISSIETKHITGSSAGSKFTDPSIKNVNDVMSLAQQQRGSLDGDDRDKLIAQGAEPSSFLLLPCTWFSCPMLSQDVHRCGVRSPLAQPLSHAPACPGLRYDGRISGGGTSRAIPATLATSPGSRTFTGRSWQSSAMRWLARGAGDIFSDTAGLVGDGSGAIDGKLV